MDFANLTKLGAIMGSGGLVVLDDDTCMVMCLSEKTKNTDAIQKLTELAKQVADVISEYSHVRVISHNDADGITSAAII